MIATPSPQAVPAARHHARRMKVLTTLDAARIGELLRADDFFWLDLMSPDDGTLRRVQEIFGFHPAAVEDSREWSQLPKVDLYGEHLLLVFFGAGRQDGADIPIEVHVYLSGSWI